MAVCQINRKQFHELRNEHVKHFKTREWQTYPIDTTLLPIKCHSCGNIGHTAKYCIPAPPEIYEDDIGHCKSCIYANWINEGKSTYKTRTTDHQVGHPTKCYMRLLNIKKYISNHQCDPLIIPPTLQPTQHPLYQTPQQAPLQKSTQ